MNEVKWFDIESCEYPHLDDFTECAHVWVFNGECVEHAFYKNPSMDECYFIDLDGEVIDCTIWADFTKPDCP